MQRRMCAGRIGSANGGGYAAGGPELLPDEPRHLGGDHYGFADGHVEWLPRKLLGVTWLGNRTWAKEPDADWVIWQPVLEDEGGAGR
jgi:prepilin-type processing-associated H-X9-DG protein